MILDIFHHFFEKVVLFLIVTFPLWAWPLGLFIAWIIRGKHYFEREVKRIIRETR